jgi:hypothetical protein
LKVLSCIACSKSRMSTTTHPRGFMVLLDQYLGLESVEVKHDSSDFVVSKSSSALHIDEQLDIKVFVKANS